MFLLSGVCAQYVDGHGAPALSLQSYTRTHTHLIKLLLNLVEGLKRLCVGLSRDRLVRHLDLFGCGHSCGKAMLVAVCTPRPTRRTLAVYVYVNNP